MSTRSTMRNIDIFASPNHPSLFPMIIPCPEISKEDYYLFYHNEREMFTLLLVVLHRELVESMLVVGFLLWLERAGYTSKNLVQISLDSLSLDIINRVADEAVICLKCMEKKGNNFLIEGSSDGYDVSLLQDLVNRKRICLKEFHENRDAIFDEVSDMANDICDKAFDDILEHFIWSGGPSVVINPMEEVVGGAMGGHRYIGPVVPFRSYNVNKYAGFHPELGFHGTRSMLNDTAARHYHPMTACCASGTGAFGAGPMAVGFRQYRDQEYELAPENRTIFLTFSKGYPILESEVREYFTKAFGDFIEAIYMHEVGPDEQPLYARIVACSPVIVTAIVDRDGPDGKSKYSINGKHVWARRYVKKKPVRVSATQPAAASAGAPPQT